MKISYNWLKDYLNTNISAEGLSPILTSIGLEVESITEIEQIKGSLKGLVLAEVMECSKHPNADKLSICQINMGGTESIPVVCGAPNVAKGQKVVFAPVGTIVHPTHGEAFEIKKAKIRGEVSEGMICAADEIGLGTDHDGIIVLNTSLPNGHLIASMYKMETDFIIEIGLTPNRSDAASHYGVARDLAAKMATLQHHNALKPLKYDIITRNSNTIRPLSVSVQNIDQCPRFAAVVIESITVAPSPDWLKNKLNSIGVKSINNVVDVTNYVLHSLGQPMHAYDYDFVPEGKIEVKNVAKDTLFTTLDQVERKLFSTDLLICNTNEAMCLAGLFGGIKSGVSEKTTTIILESAYFQPEAVRKSSTLHGIKTDASFRFERGSDPEMVLPALHWAAQLICELTHARIASDIVDIYPAPLLPREINFRPKQAERLIGIDLGKEVIKNTFDHLQITYNHQNTENWSLKVPFFRTDVTREADVIEELLRINGFDKIVAKPGLSATYLAKFPEKDKNDIQKNISLVLVAQGFREIITNSLMNEETMPIAKDFDVNEKVFVENKLSKELGMMRPSMIYTGLEVLAFNINRKNKDLKLFEFGKTYHLKEKKYQEQNHLTIYQTGNIFNDNWQSKSQAQGLQNSLDWVNMILAKCKIDAKPIISEKNIEFVSKGNVLAKIYILGKDVLKKFDIKQEVFVADLYFDAIFEKINLHKTYQEIAKFPEVKRDLSLVIDHKISYQNLLDIAQKTEKALIKEVNLFDVYQGEKLEEGKKAYALTFTLQDTEQTLTDSVIDKVMSKLIANFEKELGAFIRK